MNARERLEASRGEPGVGRKRPESWSRRPALAGNRIHSQEDRPGEPAGEVSYPFYPYPNPVSLPVALPPGVGREVGLLEGLVVLEVLVLLVAVVVAVVVAVLLLVVVLPGVLSTAVLLLLMVCDWNCCLHCTCGSFAVAC